MHTPENKFISNDVGVAVLGDPQFKKITKIKGEPQMKTKNRITLIVLIITTIFSYDEFIKFSNNKRFPPRINLVKNHKFSNI